MNQTITMCTTALDITNHKHLTAMKLRGYIANKFIDDPEFHHHSNKSYHYPLIQYKKVNHQLTIIGLQEYTKILENKITDVDQISTNYGTYKINYKSTATTTWLLTNQKCSYEFVTPWIALNEKNYNTFKTCSKNEQKMFLEKILVGNTLSCLKGLDIFVNYRIEANLTVFDSVYVRAHGNPFEAFTAQFTLNITLPDLIGLGKSVSKGFGTIKQVKGY